MTRELIQVVVYLAEHPCVESQKPKHYFTVGFKRIQVFCQKLFKEGNLKCAYAGNIYSSVARQIAEHYGWIEKIGNYRKGSHSMKFIPGTNHPRRADFMVAYGNKVQQICGGSTIDIPAPKKAG